MRRMLGFFKTILLLFCAAACVCFVWTLFSAPVFEGGHGYEFYLGASSSNPIVCTSDPAREKLFLPVAGESVRYDGDRFEEIKQKFGASVRFCEEADGVINYYMYAPALGNGVLLYGEKINLHVAVGNGQTAAGTPLIFGGF